MNRSFSPLIYIRLLFSGIINVMGYAFLSFGLIFVWAFNIPAAIEGFINFQGELAKVQGEVTSIQETAVYENDHLVYEIHYKYNEKGGNNYENFSYGVNAPVIGERVTIEYNDDNPYYSRIQGMRFSQAPVWISIILIFPLIGLIAVLNGLFKGAAAIYLVRTGEFGEGVLKSKTRTPMRINNQPVYKLAFEFKARDGRVHQCISKTHLPYKLQDNQKEKILYDPAKPQKAILLDVLPVNLKIEGSSYVFSSSGGLLLALLNMILPVATVFLLYNIFF